MDAGDVRDWTPLRGYSFEQEKIGLQRYHGSTQEKVTREYYTCWRQGTIVCFLFSVVSYMSSFLNMVCSNLYMLRLVSMRAFDYGSGRVQQV